MSRLLEEIKKQASNAPGTMISVGSLRVGYWRERDESTKEPAMLRLFRWDVKTRRHYNVTEEEAEAILTAVKPEVRVKPTPPDDGGCYFCSYDTLRERLVSFELVGPSGVGLQLRLCEPHRKWLGYILFFHEDTIVPSGNFDLDDRLLYRRCDIEMEPPPAGPPPQDEPSE